MKQSSKIFQRIAKNNSNLKGDLQVGDQKFPELKESKSDRSEPVSAQNEEELKNRGFSQPKASLAPYLQTGASSSSWFTKVNQIHLNGGGKVHNKENMRANNELNSDSSKSDDNASSGSPNTEEKSKLERRISKALKYLEQKYTSFVKDIKGVIKDRKEDVKKFEEYIRSLQGEELENFLDKTEQEYKDNEHFSQTSQDENDWDEDNLDDIKSISSISEIAQEEIIMMTNLSSTVSTGVCTNTREQSFGK